MVAGPYRSVASVRQGVKVALVAERDLPKRLVRRVNLATLGVAPIFLNKQMSV
jgi:hypothetical protein